MTDDRKDPSPIDRLIAAHPSIWAKDAPDMSFLPRGWYNLVDRALTDIETLLGDAKPAFKVEQIKEKFSALRLYYTIMGRSRVTIDAVFPAGRARVSDRPKTELSARIDELIRAAEEASARTCQTCGAAGSRRSRQGWLVTLCDEHTRELEAEDADDEDE